MSTLFSGHYLPNSSTFDIGVLGYIGIVQHKEHSPEVLSLPSGTLCICHVEYLKSSEISDYSFDKHLACLGRIIYLPIHYIS